MLLKQQWEEKTVENCFLLNFFPVAYASYVCKKKIEMFLYDKRYVQTINQPTKPTNMPTVQFTIPRPCPVCLKAGVNREKAQKCPGPGDKCPTCAGFKCGYCKGHGHTIKKCPVLAAKKAHEAQDASMQKRAVKKAFEAGAFIVKGDKSNFASASKAATVPTFKPKHTNRFTTFDDEEEQEQFPGLAAKPAAAVKKTTGPTWAALAAKKPVPQPPPCPKKEPELICTHDLKNGTLEFAPGKGWGDIEYDDDWETEIANDPFFARD